ncbi:MAG: histidine kinase [Halobacteriaceae archaeon]
MSLRRFVAETPEREHRLALVNWDAPAPLRRLLESAVPSVPIEELDAGQPEEASNVVYLLRGDEVVARSPLAALEEAILLVNSDTYRTGSGGLDDLAVPAVLEALADTRFTLRGYPESHKEKLVLIAISSQIEARSLARDAGRHRASFQWLSRLHDEQGTRTVYRRLAESGVAAHVYGQPDWVLPHDLDATMHAGWGEDFRDVWFVVSAPGDDASAGERRDGAAALVAVETEPRHWDGFWTYDPERVARIEREIERTM